MPNLYINSYTPLVANRIGREVCDRFGYPPFIDGSIRREPDLEHVYPSISCLCRADKFAPRLQIDDIVIYMTQKRSFGDGPAQRRLTAILRVDRLIEGHQRAAAWYRSLKLPLPGNCIVKSNPPLSVEHSHRMNEHKDIKDDARFTKRWDIGYQRRARKYPRFVVCEAIFRCLDWNAPKVQDQDLITVFGKIPGTQNPGALNIKLLSKLVDQLQIDVSLSSP